MQNLFVNLQPKILCCSLQAYYDDDDDDDDSSPAGVVSFVSYAANKYPKQRKARAASSTDKKAATKAPQAARTLLKAGELVHVATDVPVAAQHDMFGAVDASTFQVTMHSTLAAHAIYCLTVCKSIAQSVYVHPTFCSLYSSS